METLRRYWFRPEDEIEPGDEMRSVVADDYILVSDLVERRKQAREAVAREIHPHFACPCKNADGPCGECLALAARILDCFGEVGERE